MERLQKVLAHAGVASRRKCEELILQKRVKVNGQLVTNALERCGVHLDFWDWRHVECATHLLFGD